MWLHLASNLLLVGNNRFLRTEVLRNDIAAGQCSCEGYEFVACCCPTDACGACAVSRYGSSGITIQATR
jgi:hypothetical protein